MELAIALILIAVIIVVIYLIGRALSPTAPKTEDKLMPYACGENLPPARSPIRLLFFNFAALFMVFDVIALFLAFTIKISPAFKSSVILLVIVYGIILATAIHLLGRR